MSHSPEEEPKNPQSRRVAAAATRIKIEDVATIAEYGLAAQIRLSVFADRALAQIDQNREPRSQVGRLLARLQELDPRAVPAPKRAFGLRVSLAWSDTEEGRLGQAEAVQARLDRLIRDLQAAGAWLAREVARLDNLTESGLSGLDEVEVMIAAGQRRVDQLRGEALPELMRATDDIENRTASERAHLLSERIERLDRRVGQLRSSREIVLDTASAIRDIRSELDLLREQVQFAVTTTVPLWRERVVRSIAEQRQAETTLLEQGLQRATRRLLEQANEPAKPALGPAAGAVDGDVSSKRRSLGVRVAGLLPGRRLRQALSFDAPIGSSSFWWS